MFGILFEKTYLLVDYLGRGAFATVLLVKHVKTGKLFARKMNDTSDINSVDSAHDEIRNTPNLPGTTNIVSTKWYPLENQPAVTDTELGFHAMTMDYVNGGSLWDLIVEANIQRLDPAFPEEVRIPEVFLWKALYQMLETLLTLNLKGITHNDNHYGNWLLNWTDSATLPDVILADFGLSTNHEQVIPISSVLASASTDPSGQQLNSSESRNFLLWWSAARADMRQVFKAVTGLMMRPLGFVVVPVFSGDSVRSVAMTGGENWAEDWMTFAAMLDISMDPHDLMRAQTDAGDSFMGYSPTLVRTLMRLLQLISSRPSASGMLSEVNDKIDILRCTIDFARAQFEYRNLLQTADEDEDGDVNMDADHGEMDMKAARPTPPHQVPILFETAEELMPLRRQQDDTNPDRFDLRLRPEVYPFKDVVELRHGQYDVVEAVGKNGDEYLFNTVPLQWRSG